MYGTQVLTILSKTSFIVRLFKGEFKVRFNKESFYQDEFILGLKNDCVGEWTKGLGKP